MWKEVLRVWGELCRESCGKVCWGGGGGVLGCGEGGEMCGKGVEKCVGV